MTDGNKELHKEQGLIIPTRHIHINERDLDKYNIKDGDLVKVKVDGEKGGVMHNVHVKSGENYSFEFHIDTDDANSHLIKNGDIGEVRR